MAPSFLPFLTGFADAFMILNPPFYFGLLASALRSAILTPK
jgi:hypothetical protein